jgi:glycosyltransferase involved in cell wall biosynthesis
VTRQTRYLFASNFECDRNTGAAGSLLAIAEQLEHQGHKVDCTWQPENRWRLPHARLRETFELPEVLRQQMARQLSAASYDHVIASQPHAYRAFESLRKQYPATVFLNRTHGWEPRLAERNRQLGWRKEALPAELLSRASQMALREACRRVVRAADGVIASSTLCGAYIRKQQGLAEDRVAIIPHGIDPSICASFKAPGPRSRMLFVGQYLPRKGSALLERELLSVLNAFPTATVTFVVPNESIATVERHFRHVAGTRLTVHEWMPRERLTPLYQAHDILLFPSLFEGFGKVFLEGMAAGLCVIGSAEGAAADIAQNGRDALLAAPGDGATFRNLITWALQNPTAVNAIGAAGAETARRFTWARAANRTHEFSELRRAKRLHSAAPSQAHGFWCKFRIRPKSDGFVLLK